MRETTGEKPSARACTTENPVVAKPMPKTLTIEVPDLGPDQAPCRHAYVFRIVGGSVTNGSSADTSAYIGADSRNAVYIGGDVADTYLAEVKKLGMRSDGDRSLKIVYTPMHGVGDACARRAFSR